MCSNQSSTATSVFEHRRSRNSKPDCEAADASDEIEQAIAVLQASGTSSGDPSCVAAALEVIYRRFHLALFAIARRIVDERADAEDVVHDVFVRLPQAIRRYERGSFAGWLKQVTTYCSLMRLRAYSRRSETPLSDDHVCSLCHAMDNALETASRVQSLYGAIQRLPHSLQDVTLLRARFGFTHREIAGALGISEAASEVRLCRAVKRLRVLLASETRSVLPLRARHSQGRPPRVA